MHFYDDAQCHPKPVHELLLLHRVIRLHTWDKKRRRSAFFRKSVGSVFFADELVDGGAEQGADNRCSPEHPQLLDGPGIGIDSDTGASCRIHRSLIDWNRD